jgi:hypothetical protein
MASRGFAYPTQASLLSNKSTERLGGLGNELDVVDAQTSGYGTHIGTASDDAAAVSPLAQYESTLSPSRRVEFENQLRPDGGPEVSVRTRTAIVTSPATGCFAEAERAVYGSVKNYLLVTNFINDTYGFRDRIEHRAVLDAATKTYSSCMSDAGYTVSDPLAAEELAQQRFGPSRTPDDPPSQSERSMAIADATCQAKSGINRDYSQAFTEALSSWMNDHEGEILGLRDLEAEAKQRAERIVSRG